MHTVNVNTDIQFLDSLQYVLREGSDVFCSQMYSDIGSVKRIGPIHLEALDPIETVLYVWQLSSDKPK